MSDTSSVASGTGDTDPQFDLKKIKNSRTQIKGELTRFQNFVNKFNAENQPVESLSIRFDSNKTILTRFQEIQAQFEELLLSDFPDNYDEKEIEAEREAFETRFYDSMGCAKRVLDDCLRDKHAQSFAGAVRDDGIAGGSDLPVTYGGAGVISGRATLPSLSTKLPILKLPEFSGNYADWERFRDMFKAIIHDNNSIPEVTKFFYLEGALKGEPKNLLASLSATDQNYIIAWDLLLKRYENKKIIINSHIKEIMDIPNIHKESHVALRGLANTFFKGYRSLQSLGLNVAEWSAILIYILVQKLDNNTRREWEVFCKNIPLPNTSDFDEFLTQRCQILEALDTKSSNSISLTPYKKPLESRSFVTTNETAYKPRCAHCKEQHFIYYCDKFKQLSVTDRFNQTKKLNLCTNCLRYGHKTAECRSSGCKICKQRHATLLHQSREQRNENISQQRGENSSLNDIPQNSNQNRSPSHTFVTENEKAGEQNNQNDVITDIVNPVMSITCQNSQSHFILLSTAIINIYGSDKKPIPCRVLLDCASQSNFVTSSMIKKLNLETSKINIPVIGINQIKTNISERVEINFSSNHSKYKNKLKFLVLPTISNLCPQNTFDSSKLNIPPELQLADPSFNIPSDIDMLLGCEIFYELMCLGQIKLGKNMPILQKTLLGWVVAGQVHCGRDCVAKSDAMLSNCFFSQGSLNKDIEKFWLLEEVLLNPRSLMTKEEIECEDYFTETTIRDESGRFLVKLPLKDNFRNLGESEQTALNRLYAIERRLAKNPELERSYKGFMQEYIHLEHMTEIPCDFVSEKNPIYYIPHHCVEKPESTTTKVRVVFDAACKTSNNISLNDVLKVGPTIQNDLFSILIKFRKHNFVLIGDLEKMYRQILIDKEERNLQRIVWRNSPDEEVKHFKLNTVTYGTASASFLSTRCLRQIALDNSIKCPTESKIIDSDFYVDDLLTGAESVESLVNLKTNICQILAKYGFQLRKFQSNDLGVLKDDLESLQDKKYLFANDSSIKTLGVSWIPSLDEFEYKYQNILSENEKTTKRTILSFIAKIFDPLGILSPLSIRAKFIIQKLWQLQIDWDDNVPSEILKEWTNLKIELSQVGLIRVPRQVLAKQPTLIEIHGFSDASERAYGCCIFLRSIDTHGCANSHLLCAKSKVSPLKSVTLPRLELLGALLLARLFAKCKNALSLNINRCMLWTDSTIVLCWIANEPKFWKTFIANRVAEIHQLTQINDWNYIPSEINPSDIITRGTDLKNITNSNLWLHGPRFLVEPAEWPKNCHITNFSRSKSDVAEIRSITLVTQNKNCNTFNIFDKFSNFNKLIHVTAYCLRFFYNLKLPKERRQIRNLTISEIEKGTTTLLKLVQNECFFDDIQNLKTKNRVSNNSKLRALSPFIDDQGLIRLGGRLKLSTLNYDTKHPILLPAKHAFTRLVIESEHQRTLHSGIQCTLSHVRQKYWPIHGKNAVKACIHKCIRCFKAHPHSSAMPKMGDLPKARITTSRPFLNVAIDYAGPFDLKASKTRTNKVIKGYVCLFVCLATKAVHIEVISDLTSDGFLSILKRFVSRRGFCTDIYSDNATNFVGCNNELISTQKLIKSSNFHLYLTDTKIKWHFIPARSPNFGGLHEAAVKSCKHHLKRVLNETLLHYEEFYTLICQIEAILNSRPIVPLTTDPNDLEAITPAHFLIGTQLTAVPERGLVDTKIIFTRRYQHIQRIRQHFWKRWVKEYLHNLQSRTKWQFHKDSEIQIGSLVLLKEENVPPMIWPMGRIVDVHPGKDNVTRVVSVKTKNGVTKRAVSKLSLLPISDEN